MGISSWLSMNSEFSMISELTNVTSGLLTKDPMDDWTLSKLRRVETDAMRQTQHSELAREAEQNKKFQANF